MHTFLATLALVLFASVASAREADVNLATSPDGRFLVRVVERGKARNISYEVVTARGGKVLYRLSSSYQPEDDADWDWVWRHSCDANVCWGPNSCYVAIDEDVHRYIGEVLLVEISGGHARNIAIPEKAMLARTHFHWDRSRIRCQFNETSWASPHLLRLGLAGEIITSTLDDGRHTSEQARFNYTLRVDHGRASIVSMEKDR